MKSTLAGACMPPAPDASVPRKESSQVCTSELSRGRHPCALALPGATSPSSAHGRCRCCNPTDRRFPIPSACLRNAAGPGDPSGMGPPVGLAGYRGGLDHRRGKGRRADARTSLVSDGPPSDRYCRSEEHRGPDIGVADEPCLTRMAVRNASGRARSKGLPATDSQTTQGSDLSVARHRRVAARRSGACLGARVRRVPRGGSDDSRSAWSAVVTKNPLLVPATSQLSEQVGGSVVRTPDPLKFNGVESGYEGSKFLRERY